jgi:hypothetical protein
MGATLLNTALELKCHTTSATLNQTYYTSWSYIKRARFVSQDCHFKPNSKLKATCRTTCTCEKCSILKLKMIRNYNGITLVEKIAKRNRSRFPVAVLFDHPDLQSLNDCKFFFLCFTTVILKVWGARNTLLERCFQDLFSSILNASKFLKLVDKPKKTHL